MTDAELDRAIHRLPFDLRQTLMWRLEERERMEGALREIVECLSSWDFAYAYPSRDSVYASVRKASWTAVAALPENYDPTPE